MGYVSRAISFENSHQYLADSPWLERCIRNTVKGTHQKGKAAVVSISLANSLWT